MSIYVGWQATVRKGAKYRKAVIHKCAKRQSIRLVANRLQFKFKRSETQSWNFTAIIIAYRLLKRFILMK